MYLLTSRKFFFISLFFQRKRFTLLGIIRSFLYGKDIRYNLPSVAFFFTHFSCVKNVKMKFIFLVGVKRKG